MSILTIISKSNGASNLVSLLARFGLAAIFILAGMTKIQYFDGNAQYMASFGLPASLLPLVILLELGGGILIILGAFTELMSIVFAIFCFVSALIFHNELSDQTQFFMFYKNVAMTGGFLALSVLGAGKWSIDAKLLNRGTQK